MLSTSDACLEPLGMTDGRIKDNQITASSVYIQNEPHKARLNANNVWTAQHTNMEQWIRVKFSPPMNVSGIIMQGDPNNDKWVTEYVVQYDNNIDNEWNWKFILDDQGNKVVSKIIYIFGRYSIEHHYVHYQNEMI